MRFAVSVAMSTSAPQDHSVWRRPQLDRSETATRCARVLAGIAESRRTRQQRSDAQFQVS
eukprot:scaffold1702_cov253-Pinguiococcus_pyrenoidosus.AAC.6